MNNKHQVTAIALLSSGIDSTLATRLILDQGINVIALNICFPFENEKADYAGNIAKQIGVPLTKLYTGEDFIKVVQKPKFGYGKNMNPCIDCRIFMLKKARCFALENNADFIVTGDVVGERPKSQTLKALKLEESEAQLKGLILRPLSARLLTRTIPEINGWVDRSRLMAIRGRCRKPQLAMAKNFGIIDFRSPGGGCLLTHKEFSEKLKKLFDYKKDVTALDVKLLKFGRHFHFNSSKIIVGRNKEDNAEILKLKKPGDYVFELIDRPSPITLLEGVKDSCTINHAAKLTAQYAGVKNEPVDVKYEYNNQVNIVNVFP